MGLNMASIFLYGIVVILLAIAAAMLWSWWQMRRRIKWLRQAIQDGFDSGPGEPADVVFDRLEERYRKMSENRGQRYLGEKE